MSVALLLIFLGLMALGVPIAISLGAASVIVLITMGNIHRHLRHGRGQKSRRRHLRVSGGKIGRPYPTCGRYPPNKNLFDF